MEFTRFFIQSRQLCRSNAETQINIANLIKKYYKEKDGLYPTIDKMLLYFKREYGYEITKDIYSRALNNLFALICNTTTVYKRLDITRRDYISRCDSEGNIKAVTAPVINYYCLNSDSVLSLIDTVRELECYVPETVKGDKFYTFIKQDDIIQICSKYKRLVKLIENVDNLILEDYSDVLEAVYIMIYEYLEKHIKSQFYRFAEKFKEFEFDTCYDMILKIAMGMETGQNFWTLLSKRDGLHIMSFKQLENGVYVAIRGKADINVDCKEVYQIGTCKFIISENFIYCRSIYRELINVYDIKNKFSACLSYI